MKRSIVFILCMFLIMGCAKEKNNLVIPLEVPQQKEEPLSKENYDSTKELKEKEPEQKESKKINEIEYKVVPSSIEVFTYKGKYNRKNFDDTKLIKPFYKKTKTLKIERIYTSKNGEVYAKLSGTHLFVSMDDIKLK